MPQGAPVKLRLEFSVDLSVVPYNLSTGSGCSEQTSYRLMMGKKTDLEQLILGLGLSPDDVSTTVADTLMDLASNNAKLRKQVAVLEKQLEKSNRLADMDPLCPVFNRRAFLRELTREIASAERHETALSVLYIDLDQFKRVNDTHGHAQGDRVLIAVAKTLKSGIRRSDIIGRIGGDEFAIVLTRSPLRKALVRVKELRDAVHQSGPDLYGIGVSIGAVEWQSGSSAKTTLMAADRAMFANKSGLKPA